MSRHTSILLNLGEATLALYATRADGSPIVTDGDGASAAVWIGACENALRLSERWKVVNTRPTGSRNQKNHPLTPVYQVSISRNWVLKQTGLRDVFASRRNYVMAILWEHEDGTEWHRKVLYGVTINERVLDARDVAEGFEDQQVWDAEYIVSTSGTGTPPAISESLPYIVRWRGDDGDYDLYLYDPTTGEFTESELNISDDRATIGYNGDDLEMAFDGDAPALTVTADGLAVTAVVQGVPTPDVLPRLDFYYANQRVASLASDGTLYTTNVNDGTPEEASARFKLYAGETLKATLARSGLVAEGVAG